MISKENLEQIKEVLYMNCKTSKFCCLCLEKIPHKEHCLYIGTLKIGNLQSLQMLVDRVLNDTTPAKFRIVEALHYLQAYEYIEIKVISAQTSLLGFETFFCTPKLWQEMKAKEERPELQDSLEWYSMK